MNKIYKVIYNRARNMYQVVSEIVHSRGKTRSLQSRVRPQGLARLVAATLLAMSIGLPVGWAADGDTTGTTTGDTTKVTADNTENITGGDLYTEVRPTSGTYIKVGDTTAQNLISLDKQVQVNADAVTTNTTSIGTNATNITNLTNTVGSISAGNYIQAADSVATNLSTLDTQAKANADAIAKETTDRTSAVSAEATAREAADTDLNNKIGTIADGNYVKASDSVATNLGALDTQVKTNADAIGTNTSNIATNTSDITNLKNLSNITEAGNTVIKKQAKKAVKVAATGNATVSTTGAEDDDSTLTYTINVANNGAISVGDTNLVSGGTLYTELRPTGGTYVLAGNTTAANLLALDTNLVNVVNALGLDVNDTTKSYTSKLNKYFKVNPKITTSTDGTTTTTTYAADATANGTNSVAIGPSAQAGESTTDTTTSTTTVTGGTSSTAVGDSAKANGNQSVALGYSAQVLNTTDTTGATTTTISGGVALGDEAKVNGASDATAIGTKAQVNETATGGIAIGKNAVTGEDKGTVTVGDVTANVAAIGGADSVALGTSATANGSEALALGNGAQVKNYTTQAGTTVTKTLSTGSAAIGDKAIVTGANNALALGSGATITGTGTNSDNSVALGKSANVTNATDAIAEGTSAAVADGANNGIALGNTAKANTSNTTAIGYKASATGAGAVAIGENTSTSLEGGVSIGSGTSASGRSVVIGYTDTDSDGNTIKVESQNTNAIAIGNGAQANTNDSVSIGHQAGMNTSQSRTSGYGSLIAIGTNAGNSVTGLQNVALGSGAGSNVRGSYNVAIGSNAGAGINNASDSNPQDGYNISIGADANYQSATAASKNIIEAIAIGRSTNAASNAIALGYSAAASGDKSLALGHQANATDTYSIAIGDSTSAADGNIALGYGSQAPAVTYGTSYLTNNTDVNGYISLGGQTSATTNKTVLRRISNVADGSADQDAVTVAQLKAAYTDLKGTINTTDTKISDTYTQSAIDTKIANVESKITNAQTKYFSINTSSDTLTANADNSGATTKDAADAMAIGPNATATKAKAVAIGNNVLASGKGSIAIGTADNPATDTTVSAGDNTSANPHVTSAEGSNSVAVGTSSIAQTNNSIAIGTRASVYTSDATDSTTGETVKVGQQSIAIGYQAETRNTNAISIGSDAKAYSTGSTAVGHGAYAQGADSVVVGTSSTANGTNAGILGKSNTINGRDTYAVGSENNVNGNWGAVSYSNINGSKNTIIPIADTSGSTVNGMSNLSVTGNSNTINQGSYSDTVNNISILGNSNSVSGAATDSGNAGTTTNITVIGGSNTIAGKDGAGSDGYGIGTWKTLERTTVIGYGNTVNQAGDSTLSSLANTQILGNDVTATLGNSVYLGTGAAAKTANLADATTLTNAETTAADAVDTTGMTDTEIATAQAEAKAKARYATNLKTMKSSGTTAGLQTLNTDTTYGEDDGTSYTYAGSTPTGVITVGSVGKERRIQNVAAGLVSASSTDAVNGSQLYALTRQLRFGGDNSTFGTTSSDDKNVIARGSAQTLAITGGGVGVTTSTTNGVTTTTVDSTKLTDKNISVIADTDANALNVKLASNLTSLNTAQLGTGSSDSYTETIKLDGTGASGGSITLKDADGNLKNTVDTTGMTLASGAKFTSNGISAGSQQIKGVTAGTADTDAANVAQIKAATTEVTAGDNVASVTSTKGTNNQSIYKVNVNNLAVKANGTDQASVALGTGLNFKNGTNTTAAVASDGTVTIDTKNLAVKANGTTANVTMDNGVTFANGKNTTAEVATDGTVKINATHNKLSTVSAAAGDKDNVTLTLTDADGNQVTSTGLKNTYTTITKNGTNHTVTFTRNDGTEPTTLSLGDLDGASTEALNTAAAKATSEVTNGTNVASVEKSTGNNNQNIYKVNVDDLAVKVNSTQKSVHLKDGLVFGNGTNTTATMSGDGTITYNVSNEAIKTQAKDAINLTAGKNVTVDTVTSADGTTKTFTVNATHNKLASAKAENGDKDNVTLTLTDTDGNTITSTGLKNTYSTGGSVTYAASGEGTATVNRNDGNTYTITGLKDTKVSSGKADYTGATGTATLTMNDGTTATITGLKNDNDYVTTATVTSTGTNKNHVTLTRLGGDTVDVNLNPILDNYSLSDYQLVGNGDTQDQAYTVGSDGTVTLNVVDSKNAANKKTIQITGLASQSGVNAGRTTVKSSNGSIAVTDSSPNSDTHTYDIQVDYTKIPSNLKVQYSGDNGTSGFNTMDNATAFNGTDGQIVTKAENGKVTFNLAKNVTGIDSVTTGNAKLDTNGLTIQENGTEKVAITSSKVNMGGNVVSNIGAATADTDAATLGQVKNARTVVTAGSNVSSVDATGATDGSNQKTYTVNVDNLAVKANGTGTTVALSKGINFKNGTNTTSVVDDQGNVTIDTKNLNVKANGNTSSVTMDTGLDFVNGTNTTATVGDKGKVSYDINKEISLDKVTTGNSSLSHDGLIIKGTDGADKVTITSAKVDMGGNVIHNVGEGTADKDAVNVSQLNKLQSQVNNSKWTLTGNGADGTAVSADISDGKKVTYSNGKYTKSVVSKDNDGNATVKVDVTTGTLTAGTDGTIASTDGVATTGDVAKAVNNAAWTIEDGANTGNAQQVKAGTVVSLNAGTNMNLVQNGTAFTYNLNKDLQDMNSVNTKDTKGNTAVLNGEGLKVSDTSGNVLTQHATEIRIHDASAKENDTSTDVVLKKDGLHNGGHTISGVANGDVSETSTEAVNGSQLYKLQQQVGSGWKITGDDTAQATNVGAGAQVSVKSGKYAKATVNKSDTGATIQYDVQTQSITTSNGKAITTGDGLATTEDVVKALNSSAWNLTSGQSGTGVVSGTAVDNVTNGTTISINAGNNLMLTQSGNNFTYALNPVVTGMTTISFTGLSAGDGKPAPSDLVIGYQNGGGANQDKGYYVTGLSNTKWDQSNYQGDRAATESQLKQAIQNVSVAGGGGGFGVTTDEGANNGGDRSVTQTLGKTIGIRGDGTYDENGKLITAGNVKTIAYTDTTSNTGAVRIELNKDIDLSDTGSLTIGRSRIANGVMALSNTDSTKAITLDSTTGTATVGDVTVDGANKTVSGLANTTWEKAKASMDVSAGGYQGSTKAATESQLAAAISQATTTAQNNELHVQAGTYNVTTKTDAQTGTKTNSVTMNIVDGSGTKQGSVVINDVAKASDVGDTDKFAKDIMNQNGGQTQKTSVVEAVNNLNDKVNTRVGDNKYSAITSKDPVQDGDSSTTAIAKLNNRMTDIYTTAGQHTTVSNGDGNLQLTKTENGATNYQIDLNKEKLDLGNVTIKGNEGSIAAKSMTADTFTAGSTVVSNDGVKVGDKSALTSDTLKVNGKTYVSGDGINANSQKITNVADGSNDGDAVNVKQVNELAAQQNAAINQNASNINQLDRAVNRLDSRINRVGAGAAALAALHPGDYDPNDKVDFSAGFGNYRGASAAAVGVYYHPDETTTMSVGASFGGGENMVNAGVTWKMGKDSGHMRKQAVRTVPVQFVAANTAAAVPVSAANTTVKTPAPTTTTTTTTTANGQQVPIVAAYLPSPDSPVRAENDELKELLARQTAILEKLTEQKTGQPTAAAPAVSGDDLYPDVPENHWAYDFVGKLAKAGALKGCSVEDPVSNPMLTRNDFAQILYTALKNGATKDPALNKDGGLNHLASEFRAELKNVKR